MTSQCCNQTTLQMSMLPMLSSTSTLARWSSTTTDRLLVTIAFYVRLLLVPLTELAGFVNNVIFLVLIEPSRIYRAKYRHLRHAAFAASRSSCVSRRRSIRLTRSTIVYLTSIAISDILTLFVSIFQRGWVVDVFGVDPLAFHPLLCKIYQLVFSAFIFNSTWILVLFSVEKCVLLYFPFGWRLDHANGTRRMVVRLHYMCRHAVSLIVGLLCMCFAANVHNLWTANVEAGICHRFPSTSDFSGRVAPLMNALVVIYVPFFVVIVVNSLIIYRLRWPACTSSTTTTTHTTASVNNIVRNAAAANHAMRTSVVVALNSRINSDIGPARIRSSRGAGHNVVRRVHRHKELASLLVTSTFTFAFLLGPILTLNTLIYSLPELHVRPDVLFVRAIFLVMAKLNYGVNLYIYLIFNRPFRERFLFLLGKLASCCSRSKF